jgi:hypothetical protein
MWILIFWVVTSCSLVGGYQSFGGKSYPEDEDETIRFCETLVTT